MNDKKTERGQALILIALAAIGLFAFSALAIDGSRTFSNKRHAQNAADTAVLSAALAHIRCDGCDAAAKFTAAKTAALKLAKANGYQTDPTGSITGNITTVEVNLCSDTGVTCEGIPASATTAVKSEYIRVRIISEIPATFGRVIGRTTLQSAAESVARVQGSSTSSTSHLSDGAAMVATRDDGESQCFLMNGSAKLNTYDSGIFVNCNNPEAFYQNGSTVFTMEADSYVVGCKNNKGTVVGGTVHCLQEKMKVGPTTYAHVPTKPPTPTCSGPGGASGGTFDPMSGSTPSLTVKGGTVTVTEGNFQDLVVSSGTANLTPGTYCVNGNFNVNGGASWDANGSVRIVMINGTFKVGSSDVVALEDPGDSLEIFTNNGDFDMQGTLKATRLRFYSSGIGNLIINSGSIVKSNNAYIYLHRGAIRWNGSTEVVLKAPPEGDPYVGGVLLHMPWENEQASLLNGGSDATIFGTFLIPHSEVHFNGNTDFELHSQIIAYEYILDGGGRVDIHYLSAGIINPPNVTEPTIELTQ